jgi:glyoxylase-like metal-dependent hydrolase (beta-lactamase superfamily II)
MTHLHFDHACGLTEYSGEELVSVFPNARTGVVHRNAFCQLILVLKGFDLILYRLPIFSPICIRPDADERA